MPQIKDSLTMVYVSNMDKSIDFYVNKLGFEEKVRYGDDWAVVQAPNMQIALHPLRDKKMDFAYNMQMGFQVDDIQQSMEILKARGVNVTYIGDDDVKLAPFTDPDGNQLYLWSY